ncbi:hypothetical protein B0T24DRAFT_626750 [Lasiosphaeria ovina]|uniref:DUF7580 domain-containing protein n=1 Tax=Lasiosphaeria ovina TaxID=92902 RepID=A0AAE0N8U3_9PEZI|nr:hypothetical protein B0T24DRAFT_626750 [Lasiosphaeria ovina]
MSGLEILGVILGLYPVIAELAKKYRQMKGTDSRELDRTVDVTSAIYDATVRGLLASAVSPQEMHRLAPTHGPIDQNLWEDSNLQQKLLTRLGQQKFDLTIDYLTQMKKLLDHVKLELTTMCRSNEGFDRFKAALKRTVAGAGRPSIRETVKQVRHLNNDLRELLDDRPFSTPHQQFRDQSAASGALQTEASTLKAREFFDAIKERYTCACPSPHVIGLGCYCAPCVQPSSGGGLAVHTTDEWAFCLAFPPGFPEKSEDDVSATILLETIPENGIDASSIRNLCALVKQATAESDVRQVLLETASDSQMYRMKVTKLDPSGSNQKQQPTIRYFAELREPSNGFSTRDRLGLALRLSLAIGQLCSTPWISESWSWNDVCVTQAAGTAVEHRNSNRASTAAGAAAVKFPVMFILQDMYSSSYDTDNESTAATLAAVPAMSEVLDDEPVLTKLGLALIELAMGRSIEEMKREYGPDGSVEEHLANIYTAKKLLLDGKIRSEATREYENVVKVCIGRRFFDKDGNVRGLLSEDKLFLSCFRDAILEPLLEVWKRYEL